MGQLTKNKRLTLAIKNEIELYADMVLEIHPSKEKNIDLVAIMEAEKIKYHRDFFNGEFDGLTIINTNNIFHILIDVTTSPSSGRIRFTQAHELGHYFIPHHHKYLHTHGLMKKKDGVYNSIERLHEREADYFASCLLMPRKRITFDFQERKFSMGFIQIIANRYGVSRQATLHRYIDLGPELIMVVYSKEGKVAQGSFPRTSKLFPFKRVLFNVEGFLPDCCLASVENLYATTDEVTVAVHQTADVFKVKDSQQVPETVMEYCFKVYGRDQYISVFKL